MKLTAFFLMVGLLNVTANGISQTINLSGKDIPLQKVFEAVTKQTGFVVFGNVDLLRNTKAVSLNAVDLPLESFLRLALNDQSLNFRLEAKTIILTRKEARPFIAPEITIFPITGTVKDREGKPLSGVNVIVKGARYGTVTDASGNFSMNVSPGSVLLISFVGYESREIRVAENAGPLKVVLTLSVSALDETVVKGYYSTSKKLSTGAVGTVTTKEISKQPVSNPLNTLQGRVAGMVVSQSNGLPGSSVSIQIRGQNSLTNGTLPFYIVDGVPYNITTPAVPYRDNLNSFGVTAANGGISPFSVINPADIERIDVLKDADATAIYGSRGANGVILITTKKGKGGKTKLDLDVYTGAGKVAKQIEMLNTAQYLALRKEAFANDAIAMTDGNAPDLRIWDQNAYTNWQDKYLSGSAGTTDAQATLSGGDARTRILVKAGYHRETTVFPGDMYDARYSGRANIDHNSLDKRMNVNVGASYTSNNTNLIQTDISSVYSLPPNMPLYNPNGSLYWVSGFTNPEAYLFQKYYGKTTNLITNTAVRYTLLPGLDLKTNVGFTRIGIKQNGQEPAISKNPFASSGVLPTNLARFADITQESFVVEPQVSYMRKISRGNLSVLAGSSIQRNLNEGLSITADNYSNPTLLGTLNGAGTAPPPSFVPSYTLYKYFSLFGRFNYEWDSKYIFNATVRRDGSSRFGSGRQFGTFGSVGAAWIFSEESAIKQHVPILSLGKLRASYGTAGNDQFIDYAYLPLLYSSSGVYAYQGNSVIFPGGIANPLLAWEITRKIDVAIDLAFFNNRIQLSAAYYRNRSDNQVVTVRVPAAAGTTSYTGNVPALVQNSGMEIELTTTNVQSKTFSWQTSFNITTPRNKLYSIDPSYFNASNTEVGSYLTSVKNFIYRGADPTTGRPLYTAFNVGSPAKDTLTFNPNQSLDRRIIGTSTPSFYGGLNNEFTYRNIELSFFIHFTKREGNTRSTSVPGTTTNIDASRQERWRKPGDISRNPRATTTNAIYSSFANSDAVWGDASWLRLRNVSLSYTLPPSWITRAKITNLRVYLQAQNLLVLSKVKGVYDPETGTSMPPLRTITAGISCSF